MSNALKVAVGLGAEEKLYVDDVFSTYLYTGNGSTQTITNGIDLAGKGGLVWLKSRSNAYSNRLVDSARGVGYSLISNDTSAQNTDGVMTSFDATGFTTGSDSGVNQSTKTYVSWTFRKAPKLFDVVTYTGDGSSSRDIAHNLGCIPGMVIVKKTSGTSTYGWFVHHRSLSTSQNLLLNTTNAVGYVNGLYATSDTVFHVDATADINASGATYAAYLFAHDTTTDGIIQCGSFSGDTAVSLGWEPQFVLMKSSSAVDNWVIVDSMRGWSNDGSAGAADINLNPNLSNAESTQSRGYPTSTGFTTYGYGGATGIYLAIRRPNKPPTSGTEVYNALSFTGNATSPQTRDLGLNGFDLWISKRASTGFNSAWFDRLRGIDGAKYLTSDNAGAEAWDGAISSVVQTNMSQLTVTKSFNFGYLDNTGSTFIWWGMKRAPGVFDVVCYTGNGVSGRQISHNLSVAPELVIIKRRDVSASWNVYTQFSTSSKLLFLELTNAAITVNPATDGDVYSPTATAFTISGASGVNGSTNTFVSYLFATKAGISCVTSYTGNGGSAGSAGTSQTINCGFTTGSRFVMLKCTSHTSNWVIVDTVRGLVAGSDPTLSLNTTAAEVTGQDLLDPDNSGFIVNQLGSAAGTSANFNVTGRTYIVLSFA